MLFEQWGEEFLDDSVWLLTDFQNSVARYCGWWQWSSHGRVDKHSEDTERERTQALSGTGPQGGVMLYTFTGRSQGEKVHMPTLLGRKALFSTLFNSTNELLFALVML